MPQPSDTMSNQFPDYVASFIKATIGEVPIVGSLISEIICNIIPNQRLDRIRSFLQKLAEHLSKLEIDFQTKLRQLNNIDIFEDGCWQAIRAVSEQRMEYIANLVIAGITAEQGEHMRYKKLLFILNDLNDIEILLLYAYGKSMFGDNSLFEKHPEIRPPMATMQSSPEEFEAANIHEAYKKTLVDWGLLRETYRTPRKGELPEWDKKTGKMKSSGLQITALGRLLLSHIGLPVDNHI